MEKQRKYTHVTTAIKYLFAIFLTLASLHRTGYTRYVMIPMVELFLIAILSDMILRKHRIAGMLVNDICYLLYVTQMFVLFFGNSFIQLVMLTNLNSIQDLGGKALEFGFGFILALGCSLLPVQGVQGNVWRKRPRPAYYVVPTVLIYIIALFACGTRCSPICGYGKLIVQEFKILSLREHINEIDATANAFYSSEIVNCRTKDPQLSERPNVILIFAEGLSQNVVEDERNIMPNLRNFESISLNFINYYNHTFATYRGLIGQLYSGYQLDNLDHNNLVSIQDAFSLSQYHTAFINTEPANSDFTEYIHSFGFDEVIGNTSDERTGMTESYSDKEAYNILFDTACDLNGRGESFFIGIYTYGTHATLDSVDEKFEDGSNRFLNKFYNLDYQFGDFLSKFNESALAENTVIIFTTDHATYLDSDFSTSFQRYSRASSMVDAIPLCVYYKGMEPETYDANGRNSLDLAPTLLDYLDISIPNYFLGTSLFSELNENSQYDTIFNEEVTLLSTKGSLISVLDETENKALESSIQQYFVAKLQDPNAQIYIATENMFDSGMKTEISADKSTLRIVYTPSEDNKYTQIWFPVWSTENDQDDKIVYPGIYTDEGTWIATVDLFKHTRNGELNIHIYGGDDNATDLLGTKVIIVQ